MPLAIWPGAQAMWSGMQETLLAMRQGMSAGQCADKKGWPGNYPGHPAVFYWSVMQKLPLKWSIRSATEQRLRPFTLIRTWEAWPYAPEIGERVEAFGPLTSNSMMPEFVSISIESCRYFLDMAKFLRMKPDVPAKLPAQRVGRLISAQNQPDLTLVTMMPK